MKKRTLCITLICLALGRTVLADNTGACKWHFA